MSSRVVPSSSSGCSMILATPVPASMMIALSPSRSSAQAVWRSWAGNQPPPPRILSTGSPPSPGRSAGDARLALAALADAVPPVDGWHVDPHRRGVAAALLMHRARRARGAAAAGKTGEPDYVLQRCPCHV